MPMTSAAKHALAATIQSLRSRLLTELHSHTEATYRFTVAEAAEAGLSEADRIRRERLESWISEQCRTQESNGAGADRSREDFRLEAEKQAAYTLLNRLVLLRLMEAPGGPGGKPLRAPALVTGGWDSTAYSDFKKLAPRVSSHGEAREDETEGYRFLLDLVFEDLATELPGLYGPAGVADLIPVPAATLKHVIDALDNDVLESCWTDDMTLGWVYQYWNDPEREALDAKLNGGGKVEPHEIASKTQMFTERYMVDWLLQNSLGPMWLAMCEKHGWKPEVEANGTLKRLEERRSDWRAKRASGEVSLTDLMPLDTDAERHWAYYIPQPIPSSAVEHGPETIRELRLLDPAVGSGHFLVVALDLLVPLYEEEARHRGEEGQDRWSRRAIVEQILSVNLNGIDLDPRAIQIAAAALWLKARQIAPDAHPEQLNLVASNLRLASLPDDDPALVGLRRAVADETGIPDKLTDTLVHALHGADHLGSLLKVDAAVDAALEQYDDQLGRLKNGQIALFAKDGKEPERDPIDRDEARETLIGQLERFLAKHTSGEDLGLRLRGEQLAAGVRFVQMTREGTYDLVVANPPYQGLDKISDTKYVAKTYPLGKADLYAAFLLRGLELAREGGFASQVSRSGWMFNNQYADLRQLILGEHSVRSVADLLWCAFEQMRHDIVAMYCLMRGHPGEAWSAGLVPTPRDEREESIPALNRKRAAVLCHEGRHSFDPAALKIVPEWPLICWWGKQELDRYRKYPLAASSLRIFPGVVTGNHDRFVRNWFEISSTPNVPAQQSHVTATWPSYIKGASGYKWIEPVRNVITWKNTALQLRAFGVYCRPGTVRPRDPSLFFRRGISNATIGASFSARAHRIPGVFDNMGPTSFPSNIANALCLMNSAIARSTLSALNPGMHFEIADIGRLPLFEIEGSESIFDVIERSFTVHEAHREPSVEFRRPGPSPWRHAQEWAQAAVDRPEGDPLPNYVEELDPEPPTDHLSFALGVALGRFGPAGSESEGILDPVTADLSHALPNGILFLDTTLDANDDRDGLGHPAAAPLHEAWERYGAAIGTKRSLRDWLALDFFKDVHKGMYDSRPIHWPLSSSSRTFVAWVNIHRMDEWTLQVLLADHLNPALGRINGELADLQAARDGADKKAARAAERRYDRVLKTRDELQEFIDAVEQCASQGAPPADAKCPAREQDARYSPDRDDGVMINSAGLWPLLDPQWKEPKKWWKELATASGRKDYDWSHLAMRYWPTRVDAKCQKDPSLGVAHGCFWRYHPEKAWAWELRLQDEIGPDFRIEENPYRPGGRDLEDAGDVPHRETFLREQPGKAVAAVEQEAMRRITRAKGGGPLSEMRILETGLWSGHPEDIWTMELRVAKRQKRDFRLISPDEPEARAAFKAQHPDKVKDREDFLAALGPAALFEAGEWPGLVQEKQGSGA